MALRGRFAAHLAYHGGDARASGIMGMSPCITAGDPADFVSWRALRVSNFAQTAAVQAGIVLPRGAWDRGLALLETLPCPHPITFIPNSAFSVPPHAFVAGYEWRRRVLSSRGSAQR